MSDALSVAKEYVKLSLSGDEPDWDPLTHMRLQKLLYYAQAWSLIVRESELFPDEIEAWVWGPVVPVVYQSFPFKGAAPIVTMIFDDAPDLSHEERDFVEHVWQEYNQYSAIQLHKMTHEEAPWKNARRDLPPATRSNNPIKIDDLEDFFGTRAMPSPIATYLHDLRKGEEEAQRQLERIPSLDAERLRAASRCVTPAASRYLQGS